MKIKHQVEKKDLFCVSARVPETWIRQSTVVESLGCRMSMGQAVEDPAVPH